MPEPYEKIRNCSVDHLTRFLELCIEKSKFCFKNLNIKEFKLIIHQ